MLLPGLPEVPFGQHAQASIEKLFKALIHQSGQQYPYTHDLDRLALYLLNIGEPLPVVPVALGNLTHYAMNLRYEETGQLPHPLDRNACIETVKLLRMHVTRRIESLAANPPPAGGRSP